jgi:hypothetical protein
MLGGIKWGLIEQWDQFRYTRSQQLREHQRPTIESLPTLPWSGRSDVDVCMICGHRHLDMGIAASWSLLRFAPDWRLMVFSDGTLQPEDEERWRSVVPSLHVIDRQVVITGIERRIGDLPVIRQVWSRNLYHAQFIDAHLAADSSLLLILDSDVLCLQKPTELMDRLQSGEPRILWNRGDLEDGFCAPRADLETIFGCELPQRVNAGLLVTPRLGREHFEMMEHILERIGQVVGDADWMNHHWLAGTVYAAMAPHFPGSSMLSTEYAVISRELPRSRRPAVMRHYVSVPGVRARFFTDGITELLRQAAAL